MTRLPSFFAVMAVLLALFVVGESTSCYGQQAAGVPSRKGLFTVIKTDRGDLVLELFPDAAPKTVDNFVTLARQGFYRNVVFHRVIPEFMAQTGDPTGTGQGGPGYRFNDEINAKALGLDRMKMKDHGEYANPLNMAISVQIIRKLEIKSEEEWNRRKSEVEAESQKALKYMLKLSVMEVLEKAGYEFNNAIPSRHMIRGSLAMANAGPNTNGSQFFINQVDNLRLDGLHTVFGQLEEPSFSVLNEIIRAGNSNSKILSVEIIDKRK